MAFEASGDLQAAPAAMDATPQGPDSMPEEDVMAMVHAYGDAYSDRSMSGKVQEVKREGGTEASENASSTRLSGWPITRCPTAAGASTFVVPVLPWPMPRLGQTC